MSLAKPKELANRSEPFCYETVRAAHRAELKVPEGIELFPLSAYTPELNPSERLWSPLREAVANRSFEGIEEMEDVLIDGIRELSKQKEYLSRLTNYDWLPPA